MTASAANGFAQMHVRADVGDLPRSAVHLPPDVLDVERAHARAVGGAQLQRRVLGRDRPLRVLQRGRRRGGDCTARRRASQRSTTTTRLLQRGRLDCSSRSEAASRPTMTSTGSRTRTTGRGPIRTAARTRSTTRARSCSRARCSTATQNYSRVAFEADLPRIEAPDSGGICDRFTGSELRQPAAGLELLPDLHHRHLDAEPERRRAAACGSSAGRTSRERRTRSAATRPRSSGRCSSASTRARTRRCG